MSTFRRLLAIVLNVSCFWVGSTVCAGQLPDNVSELAVAIGPDWDSMHGHLALLERRGGQWVRYSNPVPVLFGRHGLAWGRGEIVGSGSGPTKVEHDNRAPAGVFKIGTIYTYDESLPGGSNYPHHTVGAADAWVDDVSNPNYNRHVVIDLNNPPAWFAKERMRAGDFAYRWLVEIRHNEDPPVPGYGSAIFFHIRRGPDTPSAGCTTMAESDLVRMIRWLRSDANPHYVCLPRSEYLARWQSWGLPSPEATGLF